MAAMTGDALCATVDVAAEARAGISIVIDPAMAAAVTLRSIRLWGFTFIRIPRCLNWREKLRDALNVVAGPVRGGAR